MIIWVDGPYGVGKTAVSKKLKEKLGNRVELLESDYYSEEILKKIVEEARASHTMPHIGGTIPQNNIRFLREFKNVIEEKFEDTSKHWIIDMALTRMECKENLFDCLQREGKNMVHLILVADEKTIKERIMKDENRMKDLALDYLEHNISFLNDNYPDAIRIKTDNRDIDDVVAEAIAIIKSKENS